MKNEGIIIDLVFLQFRKWWFVWKVPLLFYLQYKFMEVILLNFAEFL